MRYFHRAGRDIAAAPDLVTPFDFADEEDWRYLYSVLGDGGRGRAWKTAFDAFREALTKATGGAWRLRHSKQRTADMASIIDSARNASQASGGE